jgi:hypothetical protein
MPCTKQLQMADYTVAVFNNIYFSLHMNYNVWYLPSEPYRGVIAIVRLPLLASRALAL